MAAAQGEIVHADHPRDGLLRQRQAPQMAQRGTPGNGHGQQAGQGCDRPAASLPRHLGYLPDKTHRAALMALQQSGHLLAEGLPAQPRAGQASRRTRRWTMTWRPSTGTSLTVRR